MGTALRDGAERPSNMCVYVRPPGLRRPLRDRDGCRDTEWPPASRCSPIAQHSAVVRDGGPWPRLYASCELLRFFAC